MIATPKNPWLAKVYAYMLRTKQKMTSRQIREKFGPPSSGRNVSNAMTQACEHHWFVMSEDESAESRRHQFTALEKHEVVRVVMPPKRRKRDRAVVLPSVEVTARYASIWDCAASVEAPVPPRPASSIGTQLSSLGQWVAA